MREVVERIDPIKRHRHTWEASTNYDGDCMCTNGGCRGYRNKDGEIFQRADGEVYTKSGKLVRPFDWFKWIRGEKQK